MTQPNENPYASPRDPGGDGESFFGPQPESFVDSLKQGALLGAKWVAIVLGPLFVLALLANVGFYVYRLWLLDDLQSLTNPLWRWQTLSDLFGLIMGFLLFCMFGVGGGVVACSSLYLIRRRSAPESSDPTDADEAAQHGEKHP